MEHLNVLKPTTIQGGKFEEVRIFANTTVEQAIQVDELDVYDAAVFNGEVRAKKIKVNGTAIFNGPVIAMEIIVNGTIDFNHFVKTNQLTVKNQVNALESKVESHETIIEGSAFIKDLDGFNLTVHGMVNCQELLRCNHILITKTGRGTFNQVMSAIVTIQPESFGSEPRVTINDLIAYDVTLQNTHINHIKAQKITTDDHTVINELEYIKE